MIGFDPKEIGKQPRPSRAQLRKEGAQLPILDAQGRDINHGMYGRKNSHYQPPHTEATKRKMSIAFRGRTWSWSEESKQKSSEDRQGWYKGEDNPNWKGGVTSDLKAYNAMKAREYRARRREEKSRRSS